MKKQALLFSTLGLLALTPAFAQIPNGGFEEWTTSGTIEDPTGWATMNSLTSVMGLDPSCAQGTGGPEGQYYAQLTTRDMSGTLLPGIMFTGSSMMEAPGFPNTLRPASLSGQWKYTIQSGDTGTVVVGFTKWNNQTLTTDNIGNGAAMLLGGVNSWTNFTIPVVYESQETPDTAVVIVMSSLGHPVVGSTVSLDALSFDGTVGVHEATATDELKFYPSPATDVLHVEAARPIEAITVFGMDGRTVLERGVNANRSDLAVADLTTGRYLLQVRWADGRRTVRPFVKD